FPLTIFFFSSRRRHTSFSRDWSSDVCSSDLCAVVGVPDPTWGETVAAVVATPASPTEDELRRWVRRTLAGYKVPRRIVLVDHLPRTPTGKLEVARVRDIVEHATPARPGRPA